MYLSACDIAPDPLPKLLGDELDEQKLSMDTESLPVLDFLMVGGDGLHVGDSSKLMSSTSRVGGGCGALGCCLMTDITGGAGSFGGILCSELV